MFTMSRVLKRVDPKYIVYHELTFFLLFYTFIYEI